MGEDRKKRLGYGRMGVGCCDAEVSAEPNDGKVCPSVPSYPGKRVRQLVKEKPYIAHCRRDGQTLVESSFLRSPCFVLSQLLCQMKAKSKFDVQISRLLLLALGGCNSSLLLSSINPSPDDGRRKNFVQFPSFSLRAW